MWMAGEGFDGNQWEGGIPIGMKFYCALDFINLKRRIRGMTSQSSKAILGILISLSLVALLSVPLQAQDQYPSKPITLIVGYAAGGSSDAIARAIIEPAKEILKVPIAVVNKPGAGTAIGMEAVKNAKPDGYTLGVIVTGSLGQARLGHANYDPFKDFTPICHISRWVMGFPVNISSPSRKISHFHPFGVARQTRHWTSAILTQRDNFR